MSAMASQITGVSIVCSTVCSGADQRKHQSCASLAFVRRSHQWIPTQRASDAETLSIWWRHYGIASPALDRIFWNRYYLEATFHLLPNSTCDKISAVNVQKASKTRTSNNCLQMHLVVIDVTINAISVDKRWSGDSILANNKIKYTILEIESSWFLYLYLDSSR